MVSPETQTPPQEMPPEMKEIFAEGYQVIGHGTTLEAIQDVMEQGIESAENELHFSFIGLDPDSPDTTAKLRHWPHKDRKAIVIARLPLELERGHGLTRDAHLFTKTERKDGNSRQLQVFDRRFVAGWWDVDAQKFNPNPEYNPDFELSEAEKPLKPPEDALHFVTSGTDTVQVEFIEDDDDDPDDWL